MSHALHVTASSPKIPTELLHKILIRVIADSIHSICTRLEDIEWEMNMFGTLCSVSFSFQAITTEIVIKAFGASLDLDQGRSLFRLVIKKLKYLRMTGMKCHYPSGDNEAGPCQPLENLGSSLIFGYSLFLAAIDLRYNAVHSPAGTFQSTHDVIEIGLHMSQKACQLIEPKEIADVLYDATCNELDLVLNGLKIVKGFSMIDEYIDSLLSYRDANDDNAARARVVARTHIHEEFEKVEIATRRYTQIMRSHTPVGTRHQVSELPGVVLMIQRLCTFEFHIDEYGIRDRVDRFVKGFCYFGRA